LTYSFNKIRESGYNFGRLLAPQISISYIFLQSQESINQYCPLNLQKMFFPFYMLETFRDCIRTCTLQHRLFNGRVLDVSDKLQKTFNEAFNIINPGGRFGDCYTKRLFLNIHFMVKNHVAFIPNDPPLSESILEEK
jgi:hypothetical protein